MNSRDEWCLPVYGKAIGDRVRDATIAVEDQRFWRHGGVDGLAVVRAGWQTVVHGRPVSGASTITMQVVKATGSVSTYGAGEAG